MLRASGRNLILAAKYAGFAWLISTASGNSLKPWVFRSTLEASNRARRLKPCRSSNGKSAQKILARYLLAENPQAVTHRNALNFHLGWPRSSSESRRNACAHAVRLPQRSLAVFLRPNKRSLLAQSERFQRGRHWMLCHRERSRIGLTPIAATLRRCWCR